VAAGDRDQMAMHTLATGDLGMFENMLKEQIKEKFKKYT
jgi:hypothetical protein